MARLKTEVLKIDEIKEYENNPRRNEKALGAVLESIKKFGYRNPIIINADNVVLAGHTRLMALQEMGQEEVECIRLTDLSEQEERAFRIADNRVSEFATWDGSLLSAEMAEINEDDWSKFGFSIKEQNELLPRRLCTCPKCGAEFDE